jgi:hypothetical protein
MNVIHQIRVLSHADLKAGDWVEVKSREEILASLDERGTLDGMPFMPEMLKYCGRRFQVYKRAHKTCDFSNGMQARRVPSAVHLDAVRCTGGAHGGCQAECLLFWKDSWLKRIDPRSSAAIAAQTGASSTAPDARTHAARCTEATLHAATRETTEPDTIYSCQMTAIPQFSAPLRAKELDQYVEAFRSRNMRLREMLPPLIFRVYERVHWSNFGKRTGIPMRIYDAFQKLWGGVPYPNKVGLIPAGEKTPKGTPLNLQPGEFVRVKPHDEILKTINNDNKNRGLLFSQELVPYCGQVFRVHSRVSRIIDEQSRKMLMFGNDCIILENVICRGRYNAGLSFCPRANYPYWREIWLERVQREEVPAALLAETACNVSAAS